MIPRSQFQLALTRNATPVTNSAVKPQQGHSHAQAAITISATASSDSTGANQVSTLFNHNFMTLHCNCRPTLPTFPSPSCCLQHLTTAHSLLAIQFNLAAATISQHVPRSNPRPINSPSKFLTLAVYLQQTSTLALLLLFLFSQFNRSNSNSDAPSAQRNHLHPWSKQKATSNLAFD